MRIHIALLLSALLLAGCSRLPFSKKNAADPIQPAADTATAAATTFSTTLVEIFLDKRGTIATGTITTNAPLAAATAGTYSFETYTEGIVSHPGFDVVVRLREKSRGQVLVRRSGEQAILELLDADKRPFVKIIGAPHGNAIQGNWFFEGSDSGVATLQPRRATP